MAATLDTEAAKFSIQHKRELQAMQHEIDFLKQNLSLSTHEPQPLTLPRTTSSFRVVSAGPVQTNVYPGERRVYSPQPRSISPQPRAFSPTIYSGSPHNHQPHTSDYSLARYPHTVHPEYNPYYMYPNQGMPVQGSVMAYPYGQTYYHQANPALANNSQIGPPNAQNKVSESQQPSTPVSKETPKQH